MIARVDPLATVPAPREWADVDGCLGIDGNAKDPFGFVGNPIGDMDISKDGVSLSYFFLGLHLATFFRRNPS